MFSDHTVRSFTAGLTLVALHALEASAQTPVRLNGYAGWEYGKTTSYDYEAGSPFGSYGRANFAVLLTASPIERLTIRGQAEIMNSDGATDVTLDQAYAEWQLSDRVKLRLGRAPHPYGLYSETQNVGVLRPFLRLPSSVYGPVGLTAEAYAGAGIRGRLFTGTKLPVSFDVYGGALETGTQEAWEILETSATGSGRRQVDIVKNMLGGRAVVGMPIEGLEIGFSGYFGRAVEDAKASVEHAPAYVAYGLQGEYQREGLRVRGEYGQFKQGTTLVNTGGYAEAWYTVIGPWRLGGRYERARAATTAQWVQLVPSLLRHQDVSLAVNHWFAPFFVVKAELHLVQGNRFSLPSDLSSAIEKGLRLDERNRLVQVGANFSF